MAPRAVGARHGRVRAVRAVLVVAASVLAGCTLLGCGSPAGEVVLSEGEFVSRAGLICGRVEEQALEAAARLAGVATEADLADARRRVANLAEVVAAARVDLAEQLPPSFRRPVYERYLAALDRAAARLEAAGASVEATGRLIGGGGVAMAVAELDPAEQALGLAGCASRTSTPGAGDEDTKQALRNALAAQQVVYAGDGSFSDVLDDLRFVAPTVRFRPGLDPAPPPGVSVAVSDDGQSVFLGARSRSGPCFYVMADAAAAVGYARDPACATADTQDYQPTW